MVSCSTSAGSASGARPGAGKDASRTVSRTCWPRPDRSTRTSGSTVDGTTTSDVSATASAARSPASIAGSGSDPLSGRDGRDPLGSSEASPTDDMSTGPPGRSCAWAPCAPAIHRAHSVPKKKAVRSSARRTGAGTTAARAPMALAKPCSPSTEASFQESGNRGTDSGSHRTTPEHEDSLHGLVCANWGLTLARTHALFSLFTEKLRGRYQELPSHFITPCKKGDNSTKPVVRGLKFPTQNAHRSFSELTRPEGSHRPPFFGSGVCRRRTAVELGGKNAVCAPCAQRITDRGTRKTTHRSRSALA